MPQVNSDQANLVRQRKIRNAQYLYDDYCEAIHKTKIIGYIYLILAVVYLISIGFEAENLPYVLTTFVGGISLLFIHRLYVDMEKNITILIPLIYVAALVVEYIILGFPDDLIPYSDTYGFAQVLNEFLVIEIANVASPYFYYMLKFVLLYPLFEIIYREQKVRELSDSLKQKIGVK